MKTEKNKNKMTRTSQVKIELLLRYVFKSLAISSVPVSSVTDGSLAAGIGSAMVSQIAGVWSAMINYD